VDVLYGHHLCDKFQMNLAGSSFTSFPRLLIFRNSVRAAIFQLTLLSLGFIGLACAAVAGFQTDLQEFPWALKLS
jgi:hypothetical protein